MKDPSAKSLWEYILLTVSGFATIVQVLGLLSQSQAFFSKPSITISFVIIVLLGTIVGCIFVLYRSKPGTFTAHVHFYSQTQRSVAVGVLSANLVVSSLVLFSILWKPCINFVEPIEKGKFGVLVADFTEGIEQTPSNKGVELAKLTFDALNSRLRVSTIVDKVQVKRMCAVRSQEEAEKAGKLANASLVVWGNLAEYTKDTFEPSFTFVDPLIWPSDINPLFQVTFTNVPNIDLPTKISARTKSITAFLVGMIYLRESKSTQGYEFAVREFSSAIADTEFDLANAVKGTEQELTLRRTLATFYVIRGVTKAALGQGNEAMQDYDTAQKMDESYSSLYVAKGNHYYSIRNFKEAEIEYKKAIFLQNTPTAYYGLGNVLFYTNRYQDSIKAYLEAINLIDDAKKDDAIGIRLVLGTVYKHTGQNQLALDQLNIVLTSSVATEFQKQSAQDTIAVILHPTITETIFASPTMVASADLVGTNYPGSTQFPTLLPSDTPIPRLLPTITIFPTRKHAPPSPTMFPTVKATPTPNH